jgi:hypothetical protein
MEDRKILYGNIKDVNYAGASPSCGAFCGCACSCGFCLGVRKDSDVLESSELVKSLLES